VIPSSKQEREGYNSGTFLRTRTQEPRIKAIVTVSVANLVNSCSRLANTAIELSGGKNGQNTKSYLNVSR
jgi:hypothetical protein